MEDADAESVLRPGQKPTEAQMAQLEEFVRDSARAGDVQDVVAALKFGANLPLCSLPCARGVGGLARGAAGGA